MCKPTVSRAFGSAVRIAETICRSHSRADDRFGGITQFEFSFPRSHIQTASWPARAPAVSVANRACARAMSGSEYQFRNALPLTLPLDTTRKRSSRSVPPSAHAGIQFTPLMCPVKRVGTSATPAPAARSATAISRSSMRGSTSFGAGWKSAQVRKSLIESRPLAAIRAKSAATSVRSKSDHHPIAVRAGQ